MRKTPLLFVVLTSGLFLGIHARTGLAGESWRLAGNHPLEAETAAVTANADPSQVLTMQVRFAIRNRAELDKLLAEQQDPASPNYHKWLNTGEFDQRFGAAQSQVNAVTEWLRSQGFSVVSSSPQYVEFTGTVAQTERALSVRIAKFGNGKFYANTSDPYLPAQFEGVIGSIEGLDNLRQAVPATRQHLLHKRPAARPSSSPQGDLAPQAQWPTPRRTVSNSASTGSTGKPNAIEGGVEKFGPKDLWTFYDETPLFNNNFNGAGNCVAVIGVSDFHNANVTNFNSTFGVAPSQITRKLVGTNPGVVTTDGSDIEALLDLEYSHASAPAAGTFFYFGKNLVNNISAAVNTNLCGAITISFTICASSNSLFTNTLDPIFSKAASQGQSVFVATGDDGAAGVVFDSNSGGCVIANTQTVNEMAADPNVTAVGGTGFNPNFDGSGNDVGSVPEFAWNDSDLGLPPNVGATGGGASTAFGKPSYQSTGTPADNARDIPDISLIASPNRPGVFIADDSGLEVIGGTSLSAPLFAGFSQTLAQAAGGRLGNLNPRLYTLANQNLSGNGFRDVTSGNNNFNGVTGFQAVAGYDQATGWGTVDMTNFANVFGKIPAGPLKTAPANPTPRNFGRHVVGKNYLPKKVTLINPKKNRTTATITGVTLQNGSVFHIDSATTTCLAGMGLAAAHNCKVGITFSPTTAGGPQTDTLIITDTSVNSPQQVPLTGIGK